jgi:hypothetical protein
MRRLTFLAAVLAAGAASAATTPIDQLSNGMTATISGKVDRITDVLSDASGSVLVYIGPGIVPFDVGETLTVNGLVDRDLGRLEVYAREARRADGTVVTFDHRYE